MKDACHARTRAVRLDAPRELFSALADFYCDGLGLEALDRSPSLLAARVGATRLDFRAAPPAALPFYHFAILVPGNRFTAARDWIEERADLLPDPETGETTFDFDNWNALACYCHDPVGNIVELIAVRGLGATGSPDEPFDSRDLLAVAEIGLVGPDTAAMAETLAREAGIHIWDGTVDEPGRLAFAGELGSTVILCPIGRGWLPTGRPAEVHPLEIVFTGDRDADVQVPQLPYRVRVVRR
jgi:catechol 2,3-dioxygenase-like lactoylglutathione lyase family enzyme